jgi:hypothetical protein
MSFKAASSPFIGEAAPTVQGASCFAALACCSVRLSFKLDISISEFYHDVKNIFMITVVIQEE